MKDATIRTLSSEVSVNQAEIDVWRNQSKEMSQKNDEVTKKLEEASQTNDELKSKIETLAIVESLPKCKETSAQPILSQTKTTSSVLINRVCKRPHLGGGASSLVNRTRKRPCEFCDKLITEYGNS